MKKRLKPLLLILFTLALVAGYFVFTHGHTVAVLEPKGIIGAKQSHLIWTATWLMLIVVLPVFGLTIGIAWRYRANNPKAKHTPDWDHSLLAECIWWGIPSLIILILAIVTWKSSHDLDPYKPIESDAKPLHIQVVALTWKWLFIYPEEKIATVNFAQIPVDRPVRFELTSDAPMNSFWIPQLGGQIFAMSGMRTQLHLMADEEGEYLGLSANISGEGFSGMTFVAKATQHEDFDQWVKSVQQEKQKLDLASYTELAKPSSYHPVTLYALQDPELFEQIIMKYMHPM